MIRLLDSISFIVTNWRYKPKLSAPWILQDFWRNFYGNYWMFGFAICLELFQISFRILEKFLRMLAALCIESSKIFFTRWKKPLISYKICCLYFQYKECWDTIIAGKFAFAPLQFFPFLCIVIPFLVHNSKSVFSDFE